MSDAIVKIAGVAGSLFLVVGYEALLKENVTGAIDAADIKQVLR